LTWWLPIGTQSDEDAAERQADRDLEKVVKGIKHNTIRSVSFRGTQAKSKQFKAVADAMRVNTTIVAMDLSHVKYLKRSIFLFFYYFVFILSYWCLH
jgi:hypothetical protein